MKNDIIESLTDKFKTPEFRDAVRNLVEAKTPIRFPESMHLQAEIEDLIINIVSHERNK